MIPYDYTFPFGGERWRLTREYLNDRFPGIIPIDRKRHNIPETQVSLRWGVINVSIEGEVFLASRSSPESIIESEILITQSKLTGIWKELI